MTNLEFSNSVLNCFHKYFPNGFAQVSKHALGKGVYFHFGLIGNDKDCINGYRVNDQMKIVLSVENFDLESDCNNDLVLEVVYKDLQCKPTNDFYAMERKRLNVRKMKGSKNKLLKSLDTTFGRVKEQVNAELNSHNLYKQSEIKALYL